MILNEFELLLIIIGAEVEDIIEVLVACGQESENIRTEVGIEIENAVYNGCLEYTSKFI